MQRLLVDQKTITQTRVENIATQALAEGETRLTLEHCALTANNVTYAASGFAIGYWKFFPTGVEGQGLVPVWGAGKVTESKSDALAVGTRLYGFYPLAEELVITPQVDPHGGIIDAAPHRADLPAVYNRYTQITSGTADQDHLRALLQPLLATSYLLFDWLMDNDCFGAGQIIVGSASSKTGLGLCKFLAEPEVRDWTIIGLTSHGNRGFVESLNACDTVLSYEEISKIAKIPSVFVDMSGNAEVKAGVHDHLGDMLKHSAAVGISHWDQFNPALQVSGIKPQFFFAPAQIAKRREDWGPGVIEGKIAESWKRIARSASNWVDLRKHLGLAASAEVYATLASGNASPKDGHIIIF